MITFTCVNGGADAAQAVDIPAISAAIKPKTFIQQLLMRFPPRKISAQYGAVGFKAKLRRRSTPTTAIFLTLLV
ncbi:hypothetical protein RCC30_25535 [Pseudomonas fluorescens]|nr:hypothetical protein RCC30_25535 [Pseudomonas fluorescens]